MAKRSSVTLKQVEDAQSAWGQALVEIGEAYSNGKDFVARAQQAIDDAYGYNNGLTVLFKPTKCAQRQFRPTAEGALSYFVGDAFAPAGFPEDAGFAIAPFIDVRFANSDCILESDRAVAMGNYYFTPTDGQVVKVEYTFGYRLVKGALVIELHHSSLPYPG